jgi:hypothetical protein
MSDEPVTNGGQLKSPKRDTRFKKGQVANPRGRPKGSKHKLSEAFIAEMCRDFEVHGAEVIAKVREDKPDVYLRVVASLLPKDVNVSTPNLLENLSDEELTATLEVVRRIIAGDDDDPGSATTTH